MSTPPDAADDDLDFTAPSKPAPPPPPEKVASARKEASTGSPQLAKTGFYVAMARNAAGRIPPRNGQRHTILVIEDDADLLKLVGEVLAKAGFLTRFARSRAEALASIHSISRPFSPAFFSESGRELAIMTRWSAKVMRSLRPEELAGALDVRLPDADGFNILERIRNNQKILKLPVIMMTGRSEVTDVARGLSLGADGYVTKPFKISGLISAINTVLGIDQPA